jgi:hypothetical protein
VDRLQQKVSRSSREIEYKPEIDELAGVRMFKGGDDGNDDDDDVDGDDQ